MHGRYDESRTHTSLEASKQAGLQVNVEKSEYLYLFLIIRLVNLLIHPLKMATFERLAMTVTTHNDIHNQILKGLKSGKCIVQFVLYLPVLCLKT
jgi:hypothetical protein